MKSLVLRCIGLAGLSLCGISAALACSPGDIQCDGSGYRYVCECWTSEGCGYHPAGTCTAFQSEDGQPMTRRADYRAPADDVHTLYDQLLYRSTHRTPAR